MRNMLLFLFTMLAALRSTAQEKTAQSLRIRYACLFNELFDRERQDRHYLAELHLQGDSSYFFLTPDKDSPPESDAPNTTVYRLDTLLRVVKIRDKDRLVFGDPFLNGKDRYFADSLFPMHWQELPDEREVGGLHCKAATAHFKGREYICWYCPDIPIPEGPWKLGGLPGLILEAYDDQENLHFTLSDLEPVKTMTQVPPKGMEGNLEGYEAYRAQWRGIARKIEASMSASESGDCISCQTHSKIKFHLWERPLD